MAEAPDSIKIDPYSIIGEKQVRLEVMAQFAQGLEREIVTLRQTIDAQAARIAELENPPEVPPPSEEEIAASRMEAGE